MNQRVLIVDDSGVLRAAIKKTVMMAGVPAENIAQAKDGLEALEMVASFKPDLILLDLNMPVMDGESFAFEFAQREDLAGPAIIVVSTESNRERLDRMKGYGAVGFLHKPFEPEQLVELVNEQINTRKDAA